MSGRLTGRTCASPAPSRLLVSKAISAPPHPIEAFHTSGVSGHSWLRPLGNIYPIWHFEAVRGLQLSPSLGRSPPSWGLSDTRSPPFSAAPDRRPPKSPAQHPGCEAIRTRDPPVPATTNQEIPPLIRRPPEARRHPAAYQSGLSYLLDSGEYLDTLPSTPRPASHQYWDSFK